MPICPLQLFLCSCEASLIWHRLSCGGLGMVKLAQLELTFFMLFGNGLALNQAAAHAAGFNSMDWQQSRQWEWVDHSIY